MGVKSSIPGFSAEASLDRGGHHRERPRIGASGRFGTVEAALGRSLSAFECSGTCPAGQLLCKSDTNCVCCRYGCDTTQAGVAVCRSSPGRLVSINGLGDLFSA